MIKDSKWYKDRILWKVNKYKLFDDTICLEFEQLSINQKEYILRLIPENKIPVIIFFNDINKWTLFCSDMLFSYDMGELVNISKEEMCQKFIPTIKKNDNKITNNQQKKYIRWLYATESKKYIWFPSENALTVGHSLLKMLCKLNTETEA